MKITNKELRKFSKQIILKKIGIGGQKKIFSSKILVIGLGGLGCPLLLYLANSGVKHIGLVDHDKIEISNLNRQIIFNEQDIGKFKTSKAKEVVKSIDKKVVEKKVAAS